MTRRRLTQADPAAMDAADKVADTIEAAWDASTDAARAKAARAVLALDADALDGYVILAQSVAVEAERLALLFEAVRRGRRQWAEAIKRPRDHHFWADLDTRPFMRALHLLALGLWRTGEHEFAVREAEALLRLNPNDNQGIRELLWVWYAERGDWAALRKLLKRYRDDGGAAFSCAGWLAAFQAGEPTAALLEDVVDANPHIPTLLADPDAAIVEEDDGFAFPGPVAMGSVTEAAGYVAFARAAWVSVPGAIERLRDAASERRLDTP